MNICIIFETECSWFYNLQDISFFIFKYLFSTYFEFLDFLESRIVNYFSNVQIKEKIGFICKLFFLLYWYRKRIFHYSCAIISIRLVPLRVKRLWKLKNFISLYFWYNIFKFILMFHYVYNSNFIGINPKKRIKPKIQVLKL